MEIDGVVCEIGGNNDVGTVRGREIRGEKDSQNQNHLENIMGESSGDKVVVVLESKRKRLEDDFQGEIIGVNDKQNIEEVSKNGQQVDSVKKNKVQNIYKSLGFAEFYSVDVCGHRGGLALLWKKAGGVKVMSSNQNFIDFEVLNEQVGRWRYTGFYGFPERRRRVDFWNIIRDLDQLSNLPWCIAEDFNDMASSDEKRGGRQHPRHLIEGFNQVMADCELADLGFVGGGDLYESDVVEVYIPRERRFHFENAWIKESDCRNIVQDCWSTNQDSGIVEKMVRCCAKLEEWGWGLLKEMRAQMDSCHRDLRKYRSIRDLDGIIKYNRVRWEFMRFLEKLEIYWK
ncbi:uncharacterized protein LOC141691982 [Apium graveolens]|uniref:uncharacterized protein LOC141691982 n=1 Tax=Apium graveolens TaxID=4045 RepID=UPI003D78C967